jgi:hypothetical protein
MVVSSCRAAHRAASVATTACRKSEGGESALALRRAASYLVCGVAHRDGRCG